MSITFTPIVLVTTDAFDSGVVSRSESGSTESLIGRHNNRFEIIQILVQLEGVRFKKTRTVPQFEQFEHCSMNNVHGTRLDGFRSIFSFEKLKNFESNFLVLLKTMELLSGVAL